MATMKVRNRILLKRFSLFILCIFFMFAFVAMIIPDKSGAIITGSYVGQVYMDLNWCAYLGSGSGNIADSLISDLDGEILHVSDTPKQWIMSSYGGEEDLLSIPLHDNITEVYDVQIVLISDSTPSVLNAGHFSFCTDHPGGWDPANPWDTGVWTNSTEYTDYNVGNDEVYWNVFAERNWTLNMTISNEQTGNTSAYLGFRIIWTFNATAVVQDFDYLGFNFAYKYDKEYVPEGADYENNADLYGLIWLLVIFAPGVVLSQYFGSIGFTIGISLMLVAILTEYTSFLPVTLMGFVTIGVYYYKGRNEDV